MLPPGSNSSEGLFRIPQSPSIIGTSPSDCLMSYLGHSLGGSYPSAEVQSVYSSAPADCTTQIYWINRTYLQNRSVRTVGRSVRPKLSGSTTGKKSVFALRPTPERTSVTQDLYLGGFWRGAVDQTRQAAPKITQAPSTFP